MIQILRFLLFCLSITPAFSQSLYFKTGKNFTNYVFESSSSGVQSSIVRLKSDSGPFYELGIAFPFESSRFSYEGGISLNELNSLVESPSKSVKYKTEYIGLDNSILFSVVKTKSILWDIKFGIGIQTIIFGKEEIGGVLYDLKQFKEFNGVFFRQSSGTQIKISSSNQINFSLGYDFNFDVFNTNNDSKRLFINNGQIKFGMYYKFENRNNNVNQSNGYKPNKVNELLGNTVIETNKNNTTNTSTIPLLNSSDSKLSRIKRNPDIHVTNINENSIKPNLNEAKVINAGTNEIPPSLINRNISISNDSRIVGPDNRTAQSNLIVRQPSKNNLTMNLVKPIESKSNLNNQNSTTTSSSDNNSDMNIVKPFESKLNSNNQSSVTIPSSESNSDANIGNSNKSSSSINNQNLNSISSNDLALKKTPNSEKIFYKPVKRASKIKKSNVSSKNKSNTVDCTDCITTTKGVLTAILDRLNIIENKLNIIDKKK